MGNTCTPMVASSQCMAKPIQYCKINKLINLKKYKEMLSVVWTQTLTGEDPRILNIYYVQCTCAETSLGKFEVLYLLENCPLVVLARVRAGPCDLL